MGYWSWGCYHIRFSSPRANFRKVAQKTAGSRHGSSCYPNPLPLHGDHTSKPGGTTDRRGKHKQRTVCSRLTANKRYGQGYAFKGKKRISSIAISRTFYPNQQKAPVNVSSMSDDDFDDLREQFREMTRKVKTLEKELKRVAEYVKGNPCCYFDQNQSALFFHSNIRIFCYYSNKRIVMGTPLLATLEVMDKMALNVPQKASPPQTPTRVALHRLIVTFKVKIYVLPINKQITLINVWFFHHS